MRGTVASSTVVLYGIAVERGCRDIEIAHCQLTDLGGGGVKIEGGDAWEAEWTRTSHVTVRDCEMHRLGRIYHAASGVLMVHASHNRIVHNHISDLFYTPICCGMIWSYVTNHAHDNLIAHNHLHHFGRGLLSDIGGIYVLGVQPGTRLHRNWIHHCKSADYGGSGIYIDESASHVVVSENVVHDCTGAAMLLHKGRENLIVHNLFVGGGWSTMEISNEDENAGLTLVGNVLWGTPNSPCVLGGYGLDIFKSKSRFAGNLYWAGEPEAARFGNVRFEETPHFAAVDFAHWQTTQADLVSYEADPLVVELGTAQVALAPESPALTQLGFPQLDLSAVGPRSVDATEENAASTGVSTDAMRFA